MNFQDITAFKQLAENHSISLKFLFPNLIFSTIAAPDMSLNGSFFEADPHHEDLERAANRLRKFQDQHPNALLANGYLEQRSFYNTPAFEREHDGLKEFRNIHLGTDFWIPAGTAVHTPLSGIVVISHNNNFHKDYGPTIVLRHELDGFVFYSLYGHLSLSSLELTEKGKTLEQGDKLGTIGDENENGHWVPHLHFQLITDLLGNTDNFNGVAFPSEIEKWKKLCPDPDLLFTEHLPSGA
ncbi:MAG: peptidoglycan DD-metalloendopeptidase family protein [Bacteroidia bacterium]|nr:peptidoglycan DD-metalloendopeptidase family protein [Bacteroidia bacterium]NNF31685.1 peptidoglycan DD-metalloendopeptidase family protein [Flavobacteriaceae bacterium]NNJ81544.1 peptidoglycan DD-metalloendopeptidase family protein [Flavobacteriaceae bacterium]NNK55199.1 peptidoglycan DD-metalloendopeptidase family protein [Flavobacteriaceae bacterium]NNM10194.1 peptidoglycan DD-metalloendopeptidase family protein [Flavobacteriaceae bacterium]